MTALERKMADFYLESESGEEEMIGDEIQEFITNMFKDFETKTKKEKTRRQQVLLWKENQKLFSRLENIFRINMYDKNILQNDSIRMERNQIRQISKELGL